MALVSSVLGPCLVLLLGHGPVKPTHLKLKLNLDLRAQGQIIALVAVANAQRLSGAEVEANLSVKSMGLAVGAGYERLRLRTPGGAVETDAGFGLLIGVALLALVVALHDLHRRGDRRWETDGPCANCGGTSTVPLKQGRAHQWTCPQCGEVSLTYRGGGHLHESKR